jgi:predicted DNA-binding WGR domain protein
VRRWECTDGGSAKFWEAARAGGSVTVRFGRIGSRGQTKVTDLGSELVALSHLKKLIAEKIAKGYREVAAVPDTPGTRSAAQAPAAPTSLVAAVQPRPEPEPERPTTAVAYWTGTGEDALDLPAEWWTALRPRRGGLVVPAARPDPAAARSWRADLLASTADLHGLRAATGDRRLVAAGLTALDALDGSPDPAGLAVLGALLLAGPQANPTRIADGWFTGYGAGTAAAAAAELGRISLQWALATVELRPRRGSDHLRRWPGAAVVHRMRALLAAASDTDYTAATTALADVRDEGLPRSLASYLVPTKVDWVDELCAEAAAAEAPDELGSLLLCAMSTRDHLSTLTGARTLYWPLSRPDVVVTLIDGVGPAIAPLLAKAVDQDSGSGDRRRGLLATLARLPTDEALRLLAERLHRVNVPEALAAAAARFPARALRVLTAVAEHGGPAAEIAREHLAAHVRTHPELGAANRHGLRPDAPADALPAVLADPPWTKPAGKPVLVTGLTATEPAGVEWLPGEREACDRLLPPDDWGYDWERDPRFGWAEKAERVLSGRWADRAGLDFLADAPAEVARPVLADWRLDGRTDDHSLDNFRRVVARFGADALPLVLSASKVGAGTELLLPFTGPEVTERCTEWLVSAKSLRPLALRWLDRHPESAAHHLVPAALGKAGPARRRAEAGLRALAERGHRAAVLAAADGYGADAGAGVRALLATDPLDVLPAKLPAVPAWADPAGLPQLLLAGGAQALSTTATGHLLTMLALSTPDSGYAGVPPVIAACDPESLRDFGWALFQAWIAAGAPAKESWAFTALGRLGDDRTVLRLTPLLRTWPGEGAHARAVSGLDVLALIGTDTALVQLDNIARTVKFKGLRARAQEKIADIAAGRGLSADQLADRLVPDFGLGTAEAWLLGYGRRRFTVGLDHAGVPFVTGPDGKAKASPPKPAAADDPQQAAAAYARYAELKKALRPAAKLQVQRFADALTGQRAWTWPELRDLLLPHPLLGVLARGLVWQSAAGTFRPAEDGAPVDSAGAPVPLKEDDEVRLAHPALGSLAEWEPVFAGQRQPVPQLDRPVFRLTGPERTGGELARFHGLPVTVGKVLGLTRRGWQRAQAVDGGMEPWLARPVPGDRAVILVLDPGIMVGDPSALPDQRIKAVWLLDWPPDYDWVYQPDAPFGLLDPVSATEVLTDLIDLTAG